MRIENAINELRGAEVPEKRSEETRKRRQAPKAGDVVDVKIDRAMPQTLYGTIVAS